MIHTSCSHNKLSTFTRLVLCPTITTPHISTDRKQSNLYHKDVESKCVSQKHYHSNCDEKIFFKSQLHICTSVRYVPKVILNYQKLL